MKRALWSLPVFGFFLAWRLFASYSYYHSEDLYPANYSFWFRQVDTPQSTTNSGVGGLTSGALFTAYGDGEVKLTARIPNLYQSGTVSAFLRASADTDPATGTGSFYEVDLWSNGGMGQVRLLRAAGAGATEIAYVNITPYDGMTLRAVIRNSSTGFPQIVVYSGTSQILNFIDTDNTLSSGSKGIGASGLSGTSAVLLSHVDLGNLDTTAPNAVPTGNILHSQFTNEVDLSWTATTDDASGTGIYNYEIWRNGSKVGSTTGTTFPDTAGIVPNTTYNYVLKAVDYHLNTASTAFSVTTPSVPFTGPLPSNIPEGRQVGVRPTGTYWGAGGENIDVRSGNVNYTLPLLAAKGRGSSGVGLNLTYNSQNWRQDSGGPWEFGKDVGYGFGWRLLAGSIEYIVADPFEGPVDYIFTDSTGAEYRLDQNNSNVWSSKSSIYVWFDANTNILHFRDGSFWYFGCVSASTEADGGTMYPTTIEDTNGNQLS